MTDRPTPHLFRPFTQRGVTFKNRVFVSPMCQYRAVDGRITDWHSTTTSASALGGAAVGMVEATAVAAGRAHHPWLHRALADGQIAPLRG